jgi:hypothetical protein
MSNERSQLIDQGAALLTTGKATGAGLFAGWFSWVSQENLVWIMTIAVLSCQLISWAYRGWTCFKKWREF